MKTISLKKQDIFHGSLILVNRKYPYNEVEQSLVSVTKKNPIVLLERKPANILEKIMNELKSSKQIVPVSGWRSQQEQERIYNDSLIENGNEFTAQYVALPNHSEHQTGLAIDLGENLPSIDFLRPHFPYKGVCGAFRKKGIQFGFIERYSKGKETITEIAHEPWHFRYVGAPHAEIMHQKNLCLEEYLVFLCTNTDINRPYIYRCNGRTIKIFYLEAEKDSDTLLMLPNDYPFVVSGDNKNGFIVTVWEA